MILRANHRMFGCSLMAALIFTAPPPVAAQRYTIDELPPLAGGSAAIPFALNDVGQVVGQARPAGASDWHAVLWENVDGMFVITDLGTLGGISSGANDINDAGQVVGTATLLELDPLVPEARHAFLWQDGVMTDLGTLGGDNSNAFGINEFGQIVGDSFTGEVIGGQMVLHGFLWENGVMSDLATLDDGPAAQALDINEFGQVCGWSFSNIVGRRAVVWDNGVITDLGLPSIESVTVTQSRGHAVNNNGDVVGIAIAATGGIFGVLNTDGTWIDLGTLGSFVTFANDINDAGLAVGRSDNFAFLWTDGLMRDLRDLLPADAGWELDEAIGINNAGQIVGFGRFVGEVGGIRRAFLMTPTCSPRATLCVTDADCCSGRCRGRTGSKSCKGN